MKAAQRAAANIGKTDLKYVVLAVFRTTVVEQTCPPNPDQDAPRATMVKPLKRGSYNVASLVLRSCGEAAP